jgi:uncharacterized protein (TIGR03083 family)
MEREGVELKPALDSLESAVPRLTSLLRNISDPGARAVGTWSAGDVASHVASVFGNYVDMIEGDEPVLAETTGDIERINSMWLERNRDRDPQVASSRIEGAFDRMVKRTRAVSDDSPIAWHAGLTLPISTVVRLALGEVLVHGHDIGSASGSTWALPVEEARTVLDGIIELAPHYVDEGGARGFSARYELRIRGGLQAALIFEDGLLTLDRPEGHADCKISADPVAFLLVSYGRIAVWGPMLRGKLVAWGRKPWLGLKLPSLLRNP